jgi:hypothetical protein
MADYTVTLFGSQVAVKQVKLASLALAPTV